MRARLLLGGACLGLVFVPAAQSMPQTTTPTVYVAIHVTLSNSTVVMTPRTVPRGAAGRFIMRNIGSQPITFSVGRRTPGLLDVFGFKTVVEPGTQKTLLLYLGARGTVPYYVGNSFAGAKPAEKGKLVVGAGCALCAPPGPPIPP